MYGEKKLLKYIRIYFFLLFDVVVKTTCFFFFYSSLTPLERNVDRHYDIGTREKQRGNKNTLSRKFYLFFYFLVLLTAHMCRRTTVSQTLPLGYARASV